MPAIVQRTRRHHLPGALTAPPPGGSPPSGRAPAAALVADRRVGVFSVLGLGAHGVLSGPGDVPASCPGAGPASAVQTVTVHAGDTLWSIAERRSRGSVPIQRYVDALVRLNGDTTEIDAGQLVRLP